MSSAKRRPGYGTPVADLKQRRGNAIHLPLTGHRNRGVCAFVGG
jgi:hypothetical protein